MVIPPHQRQMGHSGHIAVGIIFVGRTESPWQISRQTGAAEAIVDLPRFNQAGFVVGIAARPSPTSCLMNHVENITH